MHTEYPLLLIYSTDMLVPFSRASPAHTPTYRNLRQAISNQLCGLTTSGLKSRWWDVPAPPLSIWLSFNIHTNGCWMTENVSASTAVVLPAVHKYIFYCYFWFAQRISGRALVRHGEHQPSVSEDRMCTGKGLTHPASSSTGQPRYHRPASPPCNEILWAPTQEWL